MKPPRIISAQAIDDRTLLVEFSNHDVKKYDISQLLDKPMFASLQKPGFLKSFSIDLDGYGLIWNDEIDISEYELWQNGVSLTDD